MQSVRGHPASREIGPVTVMALVVGLAVLWIAARPASEPVGRFVGQLLGAQAVLLMSIGLVLISVLPWVEEWFDGIDRAAIWHRRVMIAGLFLLVPHVLLAANPHPTRLGAPLGVLGLLGLLGIAGWAILPRWQSVVPRPLRALVLAARDAPGIRQVRRLFGGYERWRSWHRTAGLFVAAGFVHGVLDGTPWAAAPVLRWSYLAIGGTGLAFYVYRELLARFFLPVHDYQVETLRQIDRGLVEVGMRPLGRPVAFVPGQFAMVFLEAKDGWHRHPFTISSAPDEELLRVTVKGLGDYTSRLLELLEPGMPAVVSGPHGRFSHARGTQHQVWIAGGVGVAPFLSWLRALDEDPPYQIDFFYSAAGKAPFADEILEIAARTGSLRAHLVDTSVEGRLTTERLLSVVGGDPRELSVFMCGPQPMLSMFTSQLHQAGVPMRRIYFEYFDWR